VSDNAELELDWENIPDDVRLMIDDKTDMHHRCGLLAGFLQHDSVYANYFRVKKG
jgi:hypothetical protein